MSPLTGFIIVLVAITFQFTLYTIKRLQEPLEPFSTEIKSSAKINYSKVIYWINAELTIGRLAMIGIVTGVALEGLTYDDWSIFIKED